MALIDSLTKSTLGLQGATPTKSEGLNAKKLNPAALQGSKLDLDGKEPKKYSDNLPK